MSCLRALFVGQCYGGAAAAEGGGALRSWDLEFVFWGIRRDVGVGLWHWVFDDGAWDELGT
jgi:hypothetical protein